MENTIGKRISHHRKRLGLTQDALAEKLGVTAQAVSKWENDQSCPDIAMLPLLAALFGITTDELLGVKPVHQAEVVEEEKEETDGVHIQKGQWEFRWDGGKKDALGFAVFVLLVGGLSLYGKLTGNPANLWDILWPSALLVFGLFRLLYRFSFWKLGCAAFGGYFLAANMGLLPLELGGELLIPAAILIFGLSLLVDALRKPDRPRFRISRDGVKLCDEKGKPKHGKNVYTTDGDSFVCNVSFGEGTRVVQLPQLAEGTIDLSFGELTVDLTGCGEIVDGCVVAANCAFGELEILVPRHCRVQTETSTAFASVRMVGEPAADAATTICVAGSTSFGEITIRYV